MWLVRDICLPSPNSNSTWWINADFVRENLYNLDWKTRDIGIFRFYDRNLQKKSYLISQETIKRKRQLACNRRGSTHPHFIFAFKNQFLWNILPFKRTPNSPQGLPSNYQFVPTRFSTKFSVSCKQIEATNKKLVKLNLEYVIKFP